MAGRNRAPMEPRYERLSVLGFAGRDGRGRALYHVQCDCGTPQFKAVGLELRRKKTRSCGCLRNEKTAAARWPRRAA